MHPGLNREKTKAVLYLAAAAVLWSLGGLLIKLVSWHPVAIAGVRSAIAAVFLLAVIRRPHWTWSPQQVGGAAAYAATVILFVAANKMTTAANAILLQYTAPVYVALLGAWFLKERAGWLDWAVIMTVLAGMALFFLDGLSPRGLWGNIAAIASGLTFAILVLCLRRQKEGSPLESILLGNVLTALIGVPFMIGPPPAARDWAVLAVLGVFQLGLPYVLYSAAIKRVTALEASIIPIIEPLLNPCWVFLMMGEAPGPWALVGGVVVLAVISARCILGVARPVIELERRTP